MENSPTPTCPDCHRPLAIDGLRAMTAQEFMALPFRVSSTARWICTDHGDVGRVLVSVEDDRVEFLGLTPGDGPRRSPPDA